MLVYIQNVFGNKEINYNLQIMWGGLVHRRFYRVYSVRWGTYFQVNRVEHQKLNQTTPYGAVWLSFPS